MTEDMKIRLLIYLNLYGSKMDYINCIKSIRCLTTLSLKDIKQIVDIYGEIQECWKWSNQNV